MNTQALRDFVKANPIGVISTMAGDHISSAAVYYMIDDDGTIYFNSHRDSEKVANILANPHVSFTVFQESPAMTLQAHGSAETVADVAHIEETYTALLHRVFENGHIPPILQMPNGRVELVKVTPTWMRLSNFSHEQGADTSMMIVGEEKK